jgi:hypothetical protein
MLAGTKYVMGCLSPDQRRHRRANGFRDATAWEAMGKAFVRVRCGSIRG